jgi:aminocarboxymuconate-semialdehyde decarboxylase
VSGGPVSAVPDPPFPAVDLHGHFVIEELLRSPRRPERWRYERAPDADGEIRLVRDDDVVPCLYDPMDPDAIVRTMDDLRIGIMAINVAPFQMGYALDPELGAAVARTANESLGAAIGRYPTRFVGMGTLPMQDGAMAVAELERLMSDARFRGVQLGTNVCGVYLGDDRFRPIWRAIDELGAAVFVHPLNMIGGDRLGDYFLANLIGNLVETSRCVADVIFSGLLDELPNLRICFSHGGGAAPALLGRWDRGHLVRPAARGRIGRPPGEYFRMLYFDHIVHSERTLRFLIDLVGADHVMIGTDYPFDMGPPDPVGSIEAATTLSAQEKEMVTSLAARRFLGFDA